MKELFTQLPEPPEPRHTYRIRTSTPWGTAQSATYFGRGIIMYSTAGHGGIHVSASLLRQIPEYLRIADKYADGKQGWFEEDCAWAIVVLVFPERFTLKWRLAALETMQRTYPAEYKRFVSERESTPNEDLAKATSRTPQEQTGSTA